MPAQSQPPRRRGPRGDVSAQALLQAADEVLQTHGLAGLSLRSVARAAGVTPTALYTYFADMADLRNQLGDAFLGRLDLTLLQADHPRPALRAFLLHVLDVFAAAPGHVQLLAAQRIAGPRSMELNEALLDFYIHTVGHDPVAAADITVFVTEWVHGRLLLSPSHPATESFTRAVAQLDLDRYPLTAEMHNSTETDAGVELVVTATIPRG